MDVFLDSIINNMDLLEEKYNLSDLNWEDDTLETGIGDSNGSDPSMSGYNKGWNMDPYKERYYANKNSRGVEMKKNRLAAKHFIDIGFSSENYAKEILTLWKNVDGPLQNFYEAFTMNKCDNKTKKEIAAILNKLGYEVYPVLVDERQIHANNLVDRKNMDFSISDECLDAFEDRLSGQSKPFGDNKSISNSDWGFNQMTQSTDGIGVVPNNYEVFSRLKKKH